MSATVEAARVRTASADEAMVGRLKRGDRQALEELVDRHGEDLMRYLISIVGTRGEAEDVFQETWVKVMRRIGDFDPAREVAPWLFRVARNRAYDHLRWRTRWRFLGLRGPGNESGYEPAQPARFDSAVTARSDTEKLLARLEARFREVVWLRFCGERSLAEIAVICRLPLGTVKNRLHRAMEQLAELAEKAEEGVDVQAST